MEGEASWTLEIVDEYNNSTVWDDTFETDTAALTEAKKSILSDGVDSYIGPADGKGNRLLIDTALARSQQLLNWSCQARYSSTILELVKSGIGVGILSASAVSTVGELSLVARPLIEPDISRSLGIIRRSNRSLSDAAQLLLDLLLEEC